MIFKSKNKPNINCSININNIPIERVNNFCFLGIVINEYLTWTDHINKIVNKICRIIELLNRGKHFLPCDIYDSLISSHYKYGNLVWGINYTSIQKLQKRH